LRETDDELALAVEFLRRVEPEAGGDLLADVRLGVLRELRHHVIGAFLGELAGRDDDLIEGLAIEAGRVRHGIERLQMLGLHPVVDEVRPGLDRASADLHRAALHEIREERFGFHELRSFAVASEEELAETLDELAVVLAPELWKAREHLLEREDPVF